MRAFEVGPAGEWTPLRAAVELPSWTALATLADLFPVAEDAGTLGLARDGAPVYATASERVGSTTLTRGLARLAALTQAGPSVLAARYHRGADAFAADWAAFAPGVGVGDAPRLVLAGYRFDEGLDAIAAYLTDHKVVVTLLPLVAFAAPGGRRFVADVAGQPVPAAFCVDDTSPASAGRRAGGPQTDPTAPPRRLWGSS